MRTPARFSFIQGGTQCHRELRGVLLEDWQRGRELLHRQCLTPFRQLQPQPPAVELPELPAYPFIALSNEWDGRCAGAVAACGPGSSALNFHARAFELMPDQVAVAVIAHELCHAVFSAQGRKCPSGNAEVEAEEEEVAGCTAAWGCDEAALEEWYRTTRAARKAAGVYRCGWCGERDVPDEQAPQRKGLTGWEDVCLECAAAEAGENGSPAE